MTFGKDAEARSFAVPAELASRIGAGLYIASGVGVALADADLADCTLSGPGAAFLATMRGVPGYRQAAFPPLPDRWVSAIVQALNGDRIPPVAAITPVPLKAAPAAAPPPAVPAKKAAMSKRPLNAAELQRRSRIVAKYGTATAERQAIVNAKIADGSVS